jgi:hypothetical protein
MSLTESQILAMSAMSYGFVLIDHHASTADNALACGTFAQAQVAPNLWVSGKSAVVYDASVCGAINCHRVFHTDELVPPFLSYVDDRDRWQWKLPDSKAINAALFSRLQGLRPLRETPDAISDLIDIADELTTTFDVAELAAEGAVLAAYDQINIRVLSRHARPLEIHLKDGRVIECLGVNSSLYTSEVGNRIATPDKPAVIYSNTADGWLISLRAHADYSASVGEYAEDFQGGGHPKSAGFSIKFNQFDGKVIKHA